LKDIEKFCLRDSESTNILSAVRKYPLMRKFHARNRKKIV